MTRTALTALIALTALALSGPTTWGRLVFWAGLPDTAVLFDDPAAKGLALYRDGAYEAADAAFSEAGRSQTFNRALTLAATGKHALSVAYFDAVLFANAGDAEAHRLRELVNSMVPKTRGEGLVPGRLAGYGGLDSTVAANGALAASTPDPAWKRPIEARGFAASDAWLETLADDPGEFLRLRLMKEYERRAGAGLLRPGEGDPW